MRKGYPQFCQRIRVEIRAEEPGTSPNDISIIGSHSESSNIANLLTSSVPARPCSINHHTATNTNLLETGVQNTSNYLEDHTEPYPPQAAGKPVARGKTNNSQSLMLCRMKRRVMVKVTILGSGGLLVGGVVSLTLLHFTTYLIVSWIVIIILFSNIISHELRSYYWTGLKMTLTTLRMPAIKAPRHSKKKKMVDVGRNPALKGIHDTTAYLKALRLLSQDNRASKNW